MEEVKEKKSHLEKHNGASYSYSISLYQRVLVAMLYGVIPLIIGGLIYLLFVPTTYLSVWFNNNIFYIDGLILNGYIGILVKSFFADFLWAFSLFAMLFSIQVFNTHDCIRVMVECVVFEILIECLQLTSIIQGTFDFLDILVEISANFLCLLVLLIYLRVGGKTK